jgi:hypothetical protein
LAVITTTLRVSAGCASASQRHRLLVTRMSAIATSNAQPTCREGIAANWLATPSVLLSG